MSIADYLTVIDAATARMEAILDRTIARIEAVIGPEREAARRAEILADLDRSGSTSISTLAAIGE